LVQSLLLLDWAGTRTVRLFGLEPSAEHASIYTEEELRHLVDVSRKSGHLEADEQQLIDKVFEFSDSQVSTAMVPRTQVEALPVTASLADMRTAFLSTGYSRLPIYRDRLDDIVGLLFRKDVDMGRIPAEGFDLQNLVRSPAFMPATASLGDALRQMQVSRVHFAVNHDSGSFKVERVDGMRISRVRFIPRVNTDDPSGKTISMFSPIVGASALAMHTTGSLI